VGFRCAPSGSIGAHRIAHSMDLGAWWAPMVPVGRFQRKLTIVVVVARMGFGTLSSVSNTARRGAD